MLMFEIRSGRSDEATPSEAAEDFARPGNLGSCGLMATAERFWISCDSCDVVICLVARADIIYIIYTFKLLNSINEWNEMIQQS